MPYSVGGETFQTKKHLEHRIRGILWNGPVDVPLAGADAAIIRAVLGWHPSAVAKVGGGVSSIASVVNPQYPNTRCFWIYRTDGTSTDFSYKECLQPTTTRTRVMQMCRDAVVSDILAAREAAFVGREVYVCPVLGLSCTRDMVDVDHRPPQTFANVVDAFLVSQHLSCADIAWTTGDGMIGASLLDAGVRDAWRAYHREHAVLQVVSRDAHKALTATRRDAKPRAKPKPTPRSHLLDGQIFTTYCPVLHLTAATRAQCPREHAPARGSQ